MKAYAGLHVMTTGNAQVVKTTASVPMVHVFRGVLNKVVKPMETAVPIRAAKTCAQMWSVMKASFAMMVGVGLITVSGQGATLANDVVQMAVGQTLVQGIDCGEDSFCRDGDCIFSCADVACPAAQECIDGLCADTGCAPIRLPRSQ